MFKKILSIGCIIFCITAIAQAKEQTESHSSHTKKAIQTKSAQPNTKQPKKIAADQKIIAEKKSIDQSEESVNEKDKEEKIDMHPPYQIDAEITGSYYLAKKHIIRDVFITTPINNKFYFKVFTAQTPVQGAMSVQYYNEIDGVATFNKHGVGVFISPRGNCELLFFFKLPKLVIQQEKDCGMSPDFDIIAGGIYTQIENFNPITQKK